MNGFLVLLKSDPVALAMVNVQLDAVRRGLTDDWESERRVSAHLGGVYIVNLYFPNRIAWNDPPFPRGRKIYATPRNIHDARNFREGERHIRFELDVARMIRETLLVQNRCIESVKSVGSKKIRSSHSFRVVTKRFGAIAAFRMARHHQNEEESKRENAEEISAHKGIIRQQPCSGISHHAIRLYRDGCALWRPVQAVAVSCRYHRRNPVHQDVATFSPKK